MNNDLFTTSALIAILSSGIRLATPYLYASIGEMFGQRSGVLNLGVEGMMLMGAFSAYYIVYQTENLLLGLLIALLVGLLMGLLTAFINVTLHAEQGISGIGVFLFGMGLSEVLFRQTLGDQDLKLINGFPRINIPVLTDLPVVGEIFFNQNLLVYLAFALVPAAWFVLNKTTLGLKIRAVGQNPEAADAMGISVVRVRYFTVVLGGILAAIAGASLSIALNNNFQQNMTAGKGFIAVALVYFGAWRPVGVLIGILIFSLVDSLQLWVVTNGINIPTEYASMAPYILTILALIFASRRVDQPDALGKSFERGE